MINFRVGDIIGNIVQGFKFKVLEINSNSVIVQDIISNEILETTLKNMYLPGIKKY
jgi:uncharacterized protein YkvS